MLFIILPAYNEEKGLGSLLEDLHSVLKGQPHRILVVNDASQDHTLDVAQACSKRWGEIEVLNHPENKGLGGALMTGFKAVMSAEGLSPEHDMIITLDADNTHPADRIPLLIQAVQAGADLAIASRYSPGGEQFGLNLWRRVLSWGAGRVMKFFFPIPGVQDFSCGYRAYRLSVLKQAYASYGEQLMESRSFAAMVELLLKVAPFCQKVSEVPLSLHYERKQGKSKMKIMSTIGGYFSLIYRMKKEAWSSFEWAKE